MSPLITSHVIGETEPLTSVLNKVIAAKEVNHKGQGKQPRGGAGRGSESSPWTPGLSLPSAGAKLTLLGGGPPQPLVNTFSTSEP